MEAVKSSERQFLLQRLHEAVKQCQIQFGGKTELATDSDSRVCVLCSAWDNILQHGLKRHSRAISAVKQLSEVPGLKRIGSSLIEDIKSLEPEPSFWFCVKELLSCHELQRYNILRHVNTDAGRARAWLRAALNERTLERSLHRLTSTTNHLTQYYEDWSYLRDIDKSATLPNMAAGLGSILFAISIDRPELNSTKPTAGLTSLLTRSSSKPINVGSATEDQCPMASRSLDSPSSEHGVKPSI
jgi:sorting nexin-29